MKKFFLVISLLSLASYPALADAKWHNHRPRAHVHFPKRFMQGSCPDLKGQIYDIDRDLKRVDIIWGDGDGDTTHWRAKHLGVRNLPMNLETLNTPCYNHTGRNRIKIVVVDYLGARRVKRLYFNIYPDPNWPGPDVPECDLVPGGECSIEIGVGT